MDSRQFDKLCREAGYMDGKFTTADADLLFTSVTGRGLRRLHAAHFEAALRLLADRKRLPLGRVFTKVKRLAAESENRLETLPPPIRGKSELGRPPRSLSEPGRGWFYPLDNGWVKRQGSSEDSAEAELLMDSFVSFCWGKPDMSNRDFLRLCRDCGLLSSRFSALDADLLYAKVLPKGQRRLTFQDFEASLDEMAERKKVPTSSVRRSIAFAHGPFVQATEADQIRLHDDISCYTGTHVHGGPESGALGVGTVQRMW
ncbi:unnamed protein product [Effrenium voratum]|nr:unnamed protein product [Effrenium voratum]CAJ1439559.1 unnamed protein product [Effrenium voratum]